MVFIAAAIGVLGRESTLFIACCCRKFGGPWFSGAWAGRSGEEEASKWLCEDGYDYRLHKHVPLILNLLTVLEVRNLLKWEGFCC
jgi:hypothetical protein